MRAARGCNRVMWRGGRGILVALVMLILHAIGAGPLPGPGLLAQEPPAGGGLQATLEVLRPFVYEGDPLVVRVAIFNTTEQPWDNAAGINLLGGVRVTGSRTGRVPLKGKPESDQKRQPAQIAAGGFFGVIQDIAPLFPDVAKADTYTLGWEGAGIAAETVSIKVIPKFDPAARYVAVMETDYGNLEFELLAKDAPRHVQNFYDLALQGFYDNSVIHQLVRGMEMRGGDPTGTGAGYPIYTMEPEVTRERRHTRGSLSTIRITGQNRDNGSQFVIVLAPAERYDGQLSLFGQMIKGDEALKAIEAIPTTGQNDIPYYRPLKPVVLRSVTIRREAAGTASGSL